MTELMKPSFNIQSNLSKQSTPEARLALHLKRVGTNEIVWPVHLQEPHRSRSLATTNVAEPETQILILGNLFSCKSHDLRTATL